MWDDDGSHNDRGHDGGPTVPITYPASYNLSFPSLYVSLSFLLSLTISLSLSHTHTHPLTLSRSLSLSLERSTPTVAP